MILEIQLVKNTLKSGFSQEVESVFIFDVVTPEWETVQFFIVFVEDSL